MTTTRSGETTAHTTKENDTLKRNTEMVTKKDGKKISYEAN
jgi:hypothetical protein